MQIPELIVVYSHSVGQNVRVAALPQIGETVRALTWDMTCDGAKGTNVAVAAGRLGTKTALISRTGDDAWADAADNLLNGSGVDTAYLVRDPSLHTPTGVVFIDGAGNNTIVLSPDDQPIPHDQIQHALRAMQGARYCVSGYEIAPESADFALRTAWSLGMKTVLNPSPTPKKRPDLSFVTLLIVNAVEAGDLLRLANLQCSMEYMEAACLLQQAYGCPQVVITLGAQGYVGRDGAASFSGKGFSCKAVDTSGAGDGFLAAVVSCMIKGMCLRDACAWANHYAAFAVQAVGTVPGYLTLAQAERRMAEQM